MQYVTKSARRAFTLVEILIVVVILGILAAVVVPQFTGAADDANDATVRSQLQTLRSQVELYKAQQDSEPNFAATGWTEMIDNDYLMTAPSNPLAGSSSIDVDAITNGGWLWRDKGNGTYGLYAVDANGGEFAE